MSWDLETFQHEAVTKHGDKYWFLEKNAEAFPGQTFGLEIQEILHHAKSPYQDILVFKSLTFGNVLVLNGIVQCTEKDEFSYQEMITHVPVMSHPDPRRVLVIGGGDCGVVRELVKHADLGHIDEIVMVEIDRAVIDLSIKYLPEMAKHHSHPKVKIVIDDGFKYLESLQNQEKKFDVIITDSSDPEGPAEEFFQVRYFSLLRNAVNEKGIVIMQSSENIWLNIQYLADLLLRAKEVFSQVRYCQCYMPSYTSGQLGLIVATMDDTKNLQIPLRKFSKDKEVEYFKYYNSAVHEAAFVLPTWANQLLNEK